MSSIVKLNTNICTEELLVEATIKLLIASNYDEDRTTNIRSELSKFNHKILCECYNHAWIIYKMVNNIDQIDSLSKYKTHEIVSIAQLMSRKHGDNVSNDCSFEIKLTEIKNRLDKTRKSIVKNGIIPTNKLIKLGTDTLIKIIEELRLVVGTRNGIELEGLSKQQLITVYQKIYNKRFIST